VQTGPFSNKKKGYPASSRLEEAGPNLPLHMSNNKRLDMFLYLTQVTLRAYLDEFKLR